MEREYNLGKAPASGADAKIQCVHFAGLVRAHIGREISGVGLEIRNSEVVAMCDIKNLPAEQWAIRAVGHAPRLWQEVIYGKTFTR